MCVVTRSQAKEKNDLINNSKLANRSEISIVKRKSIHVNTRNKREEEELYDCAVILCTLKNNIRKENLKRSVNNLANKIVKALERK